MQADKIDEWFSIMHSGETQARDQLLFEKWASENPDQYLRYRELEALWDVAGDLQPPSPFAAGPPQLEIERHRASGRDHRWVVGWSLAAAVVLAVVGVLFFTRAADIEHYATAMGSPQLIQLRDGSQVHLNARSSMEIQLNSDRRDIRLRSGEALFTAAHDPKRPFIVSAANGEVRAIGTVFEVDIHDLFVRVAVIEGVVEVTRHDPFTRATRKIIARAGEAVTYSAVPEQTTDSASLQLAALGNIDDVAAWRNGQLIFDGATLSEVVRELGRYTDRELVITEAALETLRVYGIFDAHDTDAALASIEHALPIRVTRSSDDLRVFLSSRPSG
ncbi:FecR family protein [Steroidobacter sp.]|uniref:FecR family protein n=1 Tax=Steroidobacter sp. TaxID=1978227 RepID=UPI001A5E7756|nr:FecR domain-containing protein [Steroidobacter sp.]MBL8265452.1 FecR domain-containing protein [Steroidobacter sp.]